MDVQEAINQKARDLRAAAVAQFGQEVLAAFRRLETACHVSEGRYYPRLRVPQGLSPYLVTDANEKTISEILHLIIVNPEYKNSPAIPQAFLDEQIAKYLAADLLTNAAVRLQTIGDDQPLHTFGDDHV